MKLQVDILPCFIETNICCYTSRYFHLHVYYSTSYYVTTSRYQSLYDCMLLSTSIYQMLQLWILGIVLTVYLNSYLIIQILLNSTRPSVANIFVMNLKSMHQIMCPLTDFRIYLLSNPDYCIMRFGVVSLCDWEKISLYFKSYLYCIAEKLGWYCIGIVSQFLQIRSFRVIKIVELMLESVLPSWHHETHQMKCCNVNYIFLYHDRRNVKMNYSLSTLANYLDTLPFR